MAQYSKYSNGLLKSKRYHGASNVHSWENDAERVQAYGGAPNK